MAQRQHELPDAAAAHREHLVGRTSRSADALPGQKRRLRRARRARREHHDAHLVRVERALALRGIALNLKGEARQGRGVFGEGGKRIDGVAGRVHHQTVDGLGAQHLHARLAGGVLELDQAQLALVVGQARIEQGQREPTVGRRQREQHRLGAIVQVAGDGRPFADAVFLQLARKRRRRMTRTTICERKRPLPLHGEQHLARRATSRLGQMLDHGHPLL